MPKTAAQGHFLRVLFRNSDALPSFVGRGKTLPHALHLELEEPAGPEHPIHLPNVILDYLEAGDVLENDRGKGEIKLSHRQYGKIAAVVLIQENIGTVSQCGLGSRDHFAADITA
jgi:hypothetical protein